MAILYGTQSNGETLPVLVDQFGNLLAKGIEGPPGTPGTPGTPGAQGPPGKDGTDGGSFPLPPDPYEGALLGWLNNELAWIGTPPVPVPPGLFGPISGWDPMGRLTIEGDIPSQIKQGVYVYQCNEDGSIYVDGWNNTKVFSNYASADPDTGGSTPVLQNAFDGSGDNSLCSFSNTFQLDQLNIQAVSKVSMRFSSGAGGAFLINGAQAGTFGQTLNTNTLDLSFSGRITSIEINCPSDVGLRYLSVDDVLLVDGGEYPTAPNLNFRVQSVQNQELIGAPHRTDNFSIGKYLRVPQQNVARWLYDENLSKVITSMGIDFSRLNGN